uniref:Peptide methionine sulfoxide reductase MsrA 2 n=1 Tax=Sphaerodactylus townsendi TaxID=933632 RepID=A0ACB8FRL5_9SAUR
MDIGRLVLSTWGPRLDANHAVNRNPMYPPFPEGMQMAMFGMGCFWGAEKKFWQLSGVFSTQVGFSGGFTPNPTYKEVRTVYMDFLGTLHWLLVNSTSPSRN